MYGVEIPISQIYGRGVPDRLIIVSGSSVSLATTEYEIHTDIYDIAYHVFHLAGRCFTRPDWKMYFFFPAEIWIVYRSLVKYKIDLTHTETKPDTYIGQSRHLISFNSSVWKESGY